MGSGKTVVSAEVIHHTAPRRCLIVGVRDAFSQWRDTLMEQGSRRPLMKVDKTAAGKRNLAKLLAGDSGLYYSGLEMLRAQDWETVSETIPYGKELKDFLGDAIGEMTIPVKRAIQKNTYATMPPVDLLISDESHRHSNQQTASLKTIGTLAAHAKIALSGTFFGNKFENAWALTTWLWGKDIIGSKGRFERDYCVKVALMTKDGRKQLKTPSGFGLSKILGESIPGEYVETLPCYVFIATPIGPVPKPEIVKITLNVEQQRQYDEMLNQSLTWIPTSISEAREPLVADLSITQRQRLRTASLGGMTLVSGLAEDDADSIRFDAGCKSSTLTAAHAVLHRPDWVGQKVLILTHSKQFALEVARRIRQKYNVALKVGGVTAKNWEIDKASFMRPVSETDSVQYLVAVISAVGTAMDGLQANCSRVLWLSEDDSNVNNIQAANRIWRDGVDLSAYAAVKIVQKDTIAEGILVKNSVHKQMVLDSVAGAQ